MAQTLDVYPIFDVYNASSGIITFLRYQSEPQGDRWYDSVHEICCQENINGMNFTVGPNYKYLFDGNQIYHDWVSTQYGWGVPGQYDTASYFTKKIYEGPTNETSVSQQEHFTLRIMGNRLGLNKANAMGINRNNGTTVRWEGSYYLYKKTNINDRIDNPTSIFLTYNGTSRWNDPNANGIALIDVSVYKTAAGKKIWRFHNPFFNSRANWRNITEWSPTIERSRLIQIVSPYVTI